MSSLSEITPNDPPVSAPGHSPTPQGEGAGHPWHRYVALGDSFTEGIGDPDPSRPGGHRGWADRLAEELARGREDFA